MFYSIIALVAALSAVLSNLADQIDKAYPEKGDMWEAERADLYYAAQYVLQAHGLFRGPVSELTAEGIRNVVDNIVDPKGDCPFDFWSTTTGTMVTTITDRVFTK